MWAGVEKAASDYILYARSRVRQNGLDYATKMFEEDRVEKWIRDNRWKYDLTDEELIEARDRAIRACKHIYNTIQHDLGEKQNKLEL